MSRSLRWGRIQDYLGLNVVIPRKKQLLPNKGLSLTLQNANLKDSLDENI